MQIFDRVDPKNLDRREMYLSLLGVVVIVIFAVGLALLMYPAVLSSQLVLSGRALRTAFFGFCLLSVLLVGYLLDRQLVIRQLRRKLMEELTRNIDLRREASADLLSTLPGLSNFQDRLAMEYRRSASAGWALSLLVVKLNPSGNLSDKGELTAAFGDAAKSMSRKLREEQSIYLFCPGFFGIVLPGADTANAHRMADRLTEGLHDAAGISGSFTSEIRVFNYPEHAATASELEHAVRSLLPESPPERMEEARVRV